MALLILLVMVYHLASSLRLIVQRDQVTYLTNRMGILEEEKARFPLGLMLM